MFNFKTILLSHRDFMNQFHALYFNPHFGVYSLHIIHIFLLLKYNCLAHFHIINGTLPGKKRDGG